MANPSVSSPLEQVAHVAFETAYAQYPADKRKEAYQRWLDCDDLTRAQVLATMSGYREIPVDPDTFLRDPYYLGLGYDGDKDCQLYPEVVPDFIAMNSGLYPEVVLTGGIGSAKTSLALWTTARQLYLLSLMLDPHRTFALARTDEIEIICQSITATLAEDVSFGRLRALLEANIVRNGYFKRHFPFNPELKSELHFRDRIKVIPVSGSNLATIGQNVIGGIIDELNYMAVIEKSKRSPGGEAKVYNQAVEVYNSIARRRLSRFYKDGILPGVLCLVSSSKYPGQFTDKKIAERNKQLAETGQSTIYLYKKAMYDIKPDSYSKEKFRVFEGDEFRKPRVLKVEDKVASADVKLIHHIPIDFKQTFEDDVVNALREIAGVSHITKSPFFGNKEKLLEMFTERPSIFSGEWTDFFETRVKILPRNIKRPELPRWAHVDLGLTGDSAGLALGYCAGFVEVRVGGARYRMPRIVLDGVLEIRPPRGDEIQFDRIRGILFILRDKLRVNVKWVSYDTWQSKDSVQILRQKGFIAGEQSIDLTMTPAEYFKNSVYEGRLDAGARHAKLWTECKDVQIDFKEQKVDHLPDGSKDLFDAVCGVVFGITMRRETWFQYDVPLAEIVQADAKRVAVAGKVREAKTKEVGDGYDILRKPD